MSTHNLDALFHPRSVAFFGSGGAARSLGAVLAKNFFAGGFHGPIMPVHPTLDSIDGVYAFRSVTALPLVPDLAVLATPPDAVPALIEEIGKRGTRAAIVLSPHFDLEGRQAGAELRQRMLAAGQAHHLRVLGPAALGVLTPGIGLNASYAHLPAAAGGLALIAQSASVTSWLLDWVAADNVGLSLVASLGDMADVDLGDVLDYLAFDAATKAVILCIDDVTSARKFISAARSIARLKPVIVFDAGPIGKDGVDTGVSRAAVFSAAFRRAGMLPVKMVTDLVAAARTLNTSPRAEGDRLAILCNGRGVGDATAATLLREGGRLAELSEGTVSALDALLPPGWGRRNPVNIFNDASPERYASAFDTLMADAGTDALLVLNTPSAIGDADAAAKAIADRIVHRSKLVAAVWLGEQTRTTARETFAVRRVALHDTQQEAITAFLHLVAYRRNQEMLMQTPASAPEMFQRDREAALSVVNSALAAGRDKLSEAETVALLAAYGIRAVPEPLTPTVDASGVFGPFRLGLICDRRFGPVIVFGRGGGRSTPREDYAVGLPPLNLALAKMLMAETRAYRDFAADPAATPEVIEELALALVKVSQLAAELAELVEIEINDVRIASGGITIGSADVRIAIAAQPAAARLAISPYPSDLEKQVISRRGRRFLLRPIRPEDEPALQELVRRTDSYDRRLRFFSEMRELDHHLAARLTQIDYDREMAFVLVDPNAPDCTIYGVMRISTGINGDKAEYAGMVRSDLKGEGLGRVLMQEIIAYARNRRIRKIWGEVLPENVSMLKLVRSLGFTVKLDPEDPGVCLVSLALEPT